MGGACQAMADSKTKTETLHKPCDLKPPHTCTQTPSHVWEKRFLLLSFLSQRKTTHYLFMVEIWLLSIHLIPNLPAVLLHKIIVYCFILLSFSLQLILFADDDMDKAKELQVVEQTLIPHLESVLWVWLKGSSFSAVCHPCTLNSFSGGLWQIPWVSCHGWWGCNRYDWLLGTEGGAVMGDINLSLSKWVLSMYVQ